MGYCWGATTQVRDLNLEVTTLNRNVLKLTAFITPSLHLSAGLVAPIPLKVNYSGTVSSNILGPNGSENCSSDKI